MALEALKAYAAQMQNAKEELQQPETEQASKALITHMERERQAAEYAKKQAEYIKLSERLRAKINKEVQQGADIYTILLDALQCIAVMTGDSVFYTQNIERLPELPRYQSYQSYHCYQGAVTGGNSGGVTNEMPKNSRLEGNGNMVTVVTQNDHFLPDKCFICGGTDFWLSKSGKWICRKCHPPAAGAEMEDLPF